MDCSRMKPNLLRILPQEILIDILTLLPIKSTGRCRCVSKIWRKLLSESNFIRFHLDRTKHSPENELLILASLESIAHYTSAIDCRLPGEIIVSAAAVIYIDIPLSSWVVLPSCDGLVLLEEEGFQTQTLLVNPTTKEVRLLPVPSHALDSLSRSSYYGLGVMKTLPQEIVMDIFILLPVKVVGRCRCVSKSWRCLLSAPNFIRAHLDRTKHQPENELLVLGSCAFDSLHTATIECQLPSEIIFSVTELAFVTKPQSLLEDIPSCDGLILFGNIDKQSLVNPITKEVRELPAPQHALHSFDKYVLYGLGYDHVNDDYKIVSLSCCFPEGEHVMVVHVYSIRNGTWKEVDSALYESRVSGKGTWKKVESFKYRLGYCGISKGVFVGNSIHWLATNTSNLSSFIVGFNLAEEKLQIIPAPKSVYSKEYSRDRVGVLGGCLCVYHTASGKETSIWVMKEYGVKQSWTKLSIGDGVSTYMPYLCVPGRREVAMWKNFETDNMDMVVYNVDTATFRSVTFQGVIKGSFEGSFRETLVSPYYNP